MKNYVVARKWLLWPLAWLLLCGGTAWAHAPRITSETADEVGVVVGDTHQFHADQPVTWSVTGGGYIDSNGLYHAPSTLRPNNLSRGCQLLPNNNAYNSRIDGLPKHPRSDLWLERPRDLWRGKYENDKTNISYHTIKFNYPEVSPRFSFYDNVVDSNTPLQTMWEYFPSRLNGQRVPMPISPDRQAQASWFPQKFSTQDHHVLRIDKGTCDLVEQYQVYQDFSNIAFKSGNPTLVSYDTAQVYVSATPSFVWIIGANGCWSVLNGKWYPEVLDKTHLRIPVDTSSCRGSPGSGTAMCSDDSYSCNPSTARTNTQSIGVFHVNSNKIVMGADAGGSPISATSVHTQEWYGVVARCLANNNCATADIGHAVRTTLSNAYLSSYFIWPAIRYAGGYGGSDWNRRIVSDGHWDPQLQATVFTVNISLNTVKPCPQYDWSAAAGCKFHILFLHQDSPSGEFSGSFVDKWAQLNSTSPFDSRSVEAAVVDDSHFSVAVDSKNWGSQAPAHAQFYFDFIPDGAWFRLLSSFDNSQVCNVKSQSWCPYVYVLLNTLKHYGFVMLDGTNHSGNWTMGVDVSEFSTDDMVTAGKQLFGYFNKLSHPFDQYIEAVDTRALRVVPKDKADLRSTQGRVTVTATNSNGSTSVDVVLQSTGVGIFPEHLAISTGSKYQFKPWVTGNANQAVSYVMSPPILGASISQDGVFIAPPLGTVYVEIPRTIVAITSAADPDAKTYVLVEIIPVSSDGKIRILPAGNVADSRGTWKPSYTDSKGYVWLGGTDKRVPDGLKLPVLDTGAFLADTSKLKNWTGPTPDGNLYWSTYETSNIDVITRLVVPNGVYKVSLYGTAPYGGYGLGNAVFDWELQSDTIASRVDEFAQTLHDSNHGWTLSGVANVTGGTLYSGVRQRWAGQRPYGALVGAMLIEPVSGPLAIAQSGLAPVASVRMPYKAKFQAYGGTAPYNWSLAAGYLPAGLTLGQDGVLRGIPSAPGTFNVKLQVADAVAGSAISDIELLVQPPVSVATTTLPNGLTGAAYSQALACTNGAPDYTGGQASGCRWIVASGSLPPGLTLHAETISGNPTASGVFTFTVQAIDGVNNSATRDLSIAIGAGDEAKHAPPPP